LAIVHLYRECFLQNQERFHLPGAQFNEIQRAEPAPHEELLHQRLALPADVRGWASRERHLLPRPDQRRLRILGNPEPRAPPLLLQAGPPANVASPPGLVGKLKMECD